MRLQRHPIEPSSLHLRKRTQIAVDISAPAVSRHLSVLKDAGLVRDYREGKFVFYELKASVLEETLLWMMNLKEADGEEALRNHVHPDGA